MDLVCSNENFFKNPQKLPLNKLYLQYNCVNRTSKHESSVLEMLKKIEKPHDKYGSHYCVKVDQKPAIDECWIHHCRRFVTFQPFFLQFEIKENSNFLEKNQAFLECLQFFVKCTFQQFWCYVACEPQFSNLTIHFLENAVPPCAVKYLSKDFLILYDEIYNCVYKIYQRLIDFSVSETEFIEENAAVVYLRKSNLISSRVIVNFCYLFVHSQNDFVQKLISLCFSNKFKDVFIAELSTLLDGISDDLDRISLCSPLSVFNPTYIEERACYMLEAAESLLNFITVCKPAFNLAIEQQLPHRLPHIYQKVYVDLYNMYDMKGDIGYDWSKLDELIKEWLALGRQFFIQLSHSFFSYCLSQILTFKNQEREQEEYLELYLALVSTAMDDDFFITDYDEIYSVKKQFQTLIDTIPNFDKSQTEYLLHSLSNITAKALKNETVQITETGQLDSTSRPFPKTLYESIYFTLNQAVPGSNQPESVTSAVNKFDALKTQWERNPDCWIIEELPNTSSQDDFEDWQDPNRPSDYDISQQIAAVKDMLPDLDNDYILKQLQYADYKPEVVISRILDERSSKLGTVKMIAHIGKKPQHNDARDLLNDKSNDIKHLVLQASHNYEEDDYDDRKDIYNSFEADKDDSKMYSHLKQNNLEYEVISDPSSSEDEDATAPEAKRSLAFCEDPAIIRARREAQRGRVFKPPSRGVDVVGKPKGQGQDTNVQQNRDKKNINKSNRANHNRKGGAQWKHSRGMMPF